MLLNLFLSRNSVRNCTIDCDAVGIHYEVSTPTGGWKSSRLTTVTRWDPKCEQPILIGEWERNMFKSDRIRMPQTGFADFVPILNFLAEDSWLCARTNRTFLDENGNAYRWKARRCSMELYALDIENNTGPIAAYHRGSYMFSPSHARLELQAPAVDIIDYVIMTCLIMVRRSADREKAAAIKAANS